MSTTQAAPHRWDTESAWQRYRRIRRSTCLLTQALTPEDQMVQSSEVTSPTKWHLAHTTWFFETFVLLPHLGGYRAFDTRFTYLFNSYYKQLDGHPLRSIRGMFSRPSLERVLEYRDYVDSAMQRLFGVVEAPLDLIELGLQHEQQHQELIVTDIKHALWMNPLRPPYVSQAEVTPANSAKMNWVDFPAGEYEIGHAGEDFGFDNESPRHRVYLSHFALASRPVNNAEFLAFVEDGGYERPEWWLSDGWDHIKGAAIRHPLYWEREQGDWRVFTSAGMRDLAPEDPVCHVSYYEAEAYARWAGVRLPTEAEWEVAASSVPVAGNFMESGRFHPTLARDQARLSQMFGDVWEWTASPYVPYPGYSPQAGALGEYNSKFMCNQMVLRGGSCATPEGHIRATYRNFFPPHARWQFMGIRLAK